jgi:hypothetical protein
VCAVPRHVARILEGEERVERFQNPWFRLHCRPICVWCFRNLGNSARNFSCIERQKFPGFSSDAVRGSLQPKMQFVFKCKYWTTWSLAKPVNRQLEYSLPALHGPHAAIQLRGYFFPALEDRTRSRVGCRSIWRSGCIRSSRLLNRTWNCGSHRDYSGRCILKSEAYQKITTQTSLLGGLGRVGPLANSRMSACAHFSYFEPFCHWLSWRCMSP